MTGMPHGREILDRVSKLPLDRISHHAEADAAALRGIDRGLLVLLAFWSGPAREGFARLAEALSRVEGAEGLGLIVVDLDGAPELVASFEAAGLQVGGYCEVAWVRGGRIVGLAHSRAAPGTFEAHTRALIGLP